MHCEVCDHCVVLLLDDLERAGALLPAIREQLSGINASSVAWARLHRLNASITDLQNQLRSPQAPIMRPHSSWRHWNDRPQASGRTLSIWMARPPEPEPRLANYWTAPRPRWAGHRRCWQPSGLWTLP